MKIYKVKVNGKTYKVELEAIEEVKSASPSVESVKKEAPKASTSTGEGKEVLAPIQGNVLNVKVSVGSKVKKGDTLLVIEAMKLENDVKSPVDGEVSEVLVSKGQTVSSKQLLLKIK
ncbi:MAG: biotin/lipoyl-binding protein [Bacilli bacterium]|mgnify:CR=1 FL=1|nr:biotin/lipoyl-binding protein [Bacilli bacterium]